jgi:4-aminobutyrate aminotransferase/(S)-3-amino-2-methylpropionate transaminase
MVAVELIRNGDSEKPDPDLPRAVVTRAADHGLILLSCGVRANVIRFLVPLTASDAVVGEGMDRLDRALNDVTGERLAA